MLDFNSIMMFLQYKVSEAALKHQKGKVHDDYKVRKK